MPRRCPRDATSMKVLRVERVAFPFEVDVCGKCHGFFLDKGEAGKIAGGRELERLLHAYAGERGPASCPGCGDKMRLRTLTAKGHSVTVDVCSRCKGTWLDGQELAGLKAAYQAYLNEPGSTLQDPKHGATTAASAQESQEHAGGLAAMIGWAPLLK